LRSAEELRKAQERALGGKGVSELQDRLTEQRQAVRALARLGRHILADEGRPASDAIVERIAKTLDAAALDEGARFQLRAGRLTEELEPPGFEALVGLTPARPPRRTGESKSKSDGAADARRRVETAKREVRARAREAVEAERKAERAETAAAEARSTVRAARKRSDDAERALAEAEAALRQARRR
jgi:hypothetical protein